jgi:NTP pyrophosphatase (non-canonical NTP hydrolase)
MTDKRAPFHAGTLPRPNPENDRPSMKSWQEIIRAWAIRKEWRGPKAETQRTTGDDMALIHSEVSEALEAYRLYADPLKVWFTYTVVINGVKFKNLTWDQVVALSNAGVEVRVDEQKGKPEGVGPELADTIIRILDYAEHVGLDMDFEVARKMEHNDTREVRHGGAHL